MPTISEAKSLETTIGPFNFECVVKTENASTVEVALSDRTPRQELPPGMSVERCRAIVLSVKNTAPIRHLAFSCCVDNPALKGSTCFGQGLVSQEWDADGKLVVVGTEDEELLNMRLPFFESEEDAFISLTPSTIVVELNDIPPNQELSLHFVVAENPDPEPVDASAWFAADCPHKLIS